MRGDGGIEYLAPVRFQRRQSARLVDAHQPRVTGDINRQDRCQSPLDALACNEAPCRYLLPAGKTTIIRGTGGLSPDPSGPGSLWLTGGRLLR
jgi:hypothetical protein